MPVPPWEAADGGAGRHAATLFARACDGEVGVDDLPRVAWAVLQLCDELHELRERVRRLESAREGGR